VVTDVAAAPAQPDREYRRAGLADDSLAAVMTDLSAWTQTLFFD